MARIVDLTPRLLAFLLLLWAHSLATAASAPPPEAFGNLPVESNVVLSPDGHWLAWADRHETQARVVMFDLPGRKVQRILAVPEKVSLRSLVWSDNETLIVVLSAIMKGGRDAEGVYSRDWSFENYRSIAVDVSGGDNRLLPHAALIAARTPRPHMVIMAGRGVLVEVDTRTGNYTIIKRGNEHTTAWVLDRSAQPVAREDWDFRHHAYRLLALLPGDKIKEIFRKDDSERPLLAGIVADGSAVVLLATNGRSHQAAWTVPLDGSPQTLLAEDPNEDITSVYTDPYSGAIIGLYVSGSVSDVRWLDPAAQHRYGVLQHTFSGRHVGLYGWTADASKTLASVGTLFGPKTYYIVDFTTHRADIVAEEYPALADVPLGDVKEISYKARDGATIPAYLTTPAAKTTGPISLIVLPHGGPQTRDHPSFNWLVQFLASRGYAVLQPQFRGSTGYGEAFRDAGYHQWGGLMQDDVTDGVRAMIDQGVADPHRICILGQDYGGYVALAGAAFTPDLYSCAVSITGISDLPALLREDVPLLFGAVSTTLSQWKAHIGAPGDPMLAAKSPINSVKSIKIPILIVYGTGDSAVPQSQSEAMVKALQSAGKSVTVAVVADDDTWLSSTETRVQVLKELDTFLAQHL
jgi:dipeptidyl aminopeptidase/acylaminoacyl peptidase